VDNDRSDSITILSLCITLTRPAIYRRYTHLADMIAVVGSFCIVMKAL